MTRPGDSDVIAGGAGGMGPCPPPQHQPSDGVYTHIMHIQCIYQKNTLYIPKIYYIFTKYILGIYKEYTIYIFGIYIVYTKDNYVVYTMNLLGI
jgi:hypothetical protein